MSAARVLGLRHLLPPLAFALAACPAAPSDAECAQMLDRYVEMTLGQDPSLAGLTGDRLTEARDLRRAAKRIEPAYERAKKQCRREVSRREYECAMKAPTANDWEACIE